MPAPDRDSLPPDALRVPPLCDACARTVVQRLGIGPSGPWQSRIVEASLLAFRAANLDARFAQRAGPTFDLFAINLVLAEIGCLACWVPGSLDAAIEVLRDRAHPLAAADILYGRHRHPAWPAKWYLDADRGGQADGAL